MPDSVRREIVDDVRAAKKFRLPWWAVLSWMACCAIILWPLYRHDRLDLGLPLLNSIGVCVLAIVLKWNRRRHSLFWGTMAVVALCHVPLVVFVPWTTKWIPASATAVVDSIDLIGIIILVDVVTYVSARRQTRGQ
jgi:hypothetical protein